MSTQVLRALKVASPLIVAICVVIIYINVKYNSYNIIDTKQLAKSRSSKGSFPCRPARFDGHWFPMCTYTRSQDPFWHQFVLHRQWIYFEHSMVSNLLQMLKSSSSRELRKFVDIGAHLGTYTLAIAHAGFNVISIEPNFETVRRLATSIHFGHISDRVVLLHNAVSNEQKTVQLAISSRNVGDTFLVNSSSECYKPKLNFNNETEHMYRCSRVAVKSIVLDNIIPLVENKEIVMKVDTQNSEIKIFNSRTASEFFRRVTVVAVQMKWWAPYHVRNPVELVDDMLSFFKERGYIAHDTEFKVLDNDWRNWDLVDIIFVKNRTLAGW